MKKYILSNGLELPIVGFGVFRTKEGEEAINAVKWALESGYTNIDTAFIYGNEKSCGKAIKESFVPREKITITTKLWNEDIRNRNTREAFNRSLELLQVDYVDVYLIHWPAEGYVEAWKEMEKIYEEGLAKSIGVCNFNIHHLEELAKHSKIKPMINQVESHPLYLNKEIIEYSQKNDMLVQVYSPLGGENQNLCNNELIKELALKYNKTTAQIILAWQISRNVMPLPKSIKEERIKSNIDFTDINLSKEDIEKINSLNINSKSGADPENFDF